MNIKIFFLCFIVIFIVGCNIFMPLSPPTFGQYINKYFYGNFNGSLYTVGSNSSANPSNALFMVISDTRWTPQFLVQDGGPWQASFIARSFIVVNQNNTLLNSSQNNDCRDWGFQHIDCNTATTGADFGVMGDSEFQELVFTKKGFRSYVDVQSAFFIASENSTPKYSGINGSYDVTTKIFCDYVSDNFADTGGWIEITSEASFFEGATADFDTYINSSCISLKNNPGWKTAMVDEEWQMVNSPDFVVVKGGFAEYYVGDDPSSQFKVRIKNGTGPAGVSIADDAGAEQHTAFTVDMDMNGYDGSVGQLIYMSSSKLMNNSFATALLIEGDATNLENTDGVYIDMRLIGTPVKGSTGQFDGIHMPTELDHLILVGSTDTINKAYSESIDVTTNFTGTGNDAEIFLLDDDFIYIGSTLNFTSISIALSTGANADVTLTYWYCDGAVWNVLPGVTDSTAGFRVSGTISFPSPADRGICNFEFDGTPFDDATEYHYIGLQRTRNLILTNPIVDIMSIAGGNTYFILQQDMMKLQPVSTAPETCNAEILGAIYFDIEEDAMCVCMTTGWKEMNAAGSNCG